MTTSTIPLNQTTNLRDYRNAGGNPDSAANQSICGRLVGREILHCISSTVSYFSENPEFCDEATVSSDDVTSLCCGYEYEEPGTEHVAEMDRDDLLEWLIDANVALPNEFGELDSDDEDDGAVELDAGGHLSDDELRAMLIANCGDWEQFCRDQDVEPHDVDIYEHWAVTDWMAERLKGFGEVTGELLDFTVWGRGCTGQAIKMDYVIQAIAANMEILEGQRNSWAK